MDSNLTPAQARQLLQRIRMNPEGSYPLEVMRTADAIERRIATWEEMRALGRVDEADALAAELLNWAETLKNLRSL